jgi:hypothetical protein
VLFFRPKYKNIFVIGRGACRVLWGAFHRSRIRGFRGEGGTLRLIQTGPHGRPNLSESITMNSYVKAYLTFLAFQAVTRVVVRPIAVSLNVPLITTIVG